MSSRLRFPIAASTGLSFCLNIAVLGTAARSLAVYNQQHSTNIWLLPLWPGHFDMRELQALIGSAVALAFINAGLCNIALFTPQRLAQLAVAGTALLGTVVAIFALAFPAALNQRAPARDTLQTWSCRWSTAPTQPGERLPAQFHGLCHKTRFAFYATIPILLLQCLALALTALAAASTRRLHSRSAAAQQQKQDWYAMDKPQADGEDGSAGSSASGPRLGRWGILGARSARAWVVGGKSEEESGRAA